MRNLIFTAALAFAGLFAVNANAADFEAGKNYTELNQAVPVAQPGKIEVVELFWYGCPHCYAFEPTINPCAAWHWAANWEKKSVAVFMNGAPTPAAN